MTYAYIQENTVVLVERRTENYPDDPYPIKRFYHGAMLPFFKLVPDEIKDKIQPGWLYSDDTGFYEPKAFDVNPQTGKIYLPSNISLENLYEILSQNFEARNRELEDQLTETQIALCELYERTR